MLFARLAVTRRRGMNSRMDTWQILVIYCVAIVAASLLGGLIPMWVRLTHRRMQVALSFVSGVMLGVAVLHLLPHALLEAAALEPAVVEPVGAGDAGHDHDHGAGSGGMFAVMWLLLVGFVAMLLLERFFCFHHHDVAEIDTPEGDGTRVGCGHDHAPGHGGHRLAWSGAAVGMTLHTLVAGAALAASVVSEQSHTTWPGLATFFVILLHKPFDSLTIGTLMAAGKHGRGGRHLVNLLFALVIPLGVGLFLLGVASAPPFALAAALALSAGAFLCIALSDLIPELQFHHHDRILLSVALLAGIGVAALIGWAEGVG